MDSPPDLVDEDSGAVLALAVRCDASGGTDPVRAETRCCLAASLTVRSATTPRSTSMLSNDGGDGPHGERRWRGLGPIESVRGVKINIY